MLAERDIEQKKKLIKHLIRNAEMHRKRILFANHNVVKQYVCGTKLMRKIKEEDLMLKEVIQK